MSFVTRMAPVVGALMLASFAHAEPITVTESFVSSGLLNGVAFTDQLITLYGAGDTSALVSTLAPTYRLPVAATVTIGSLGTFAFTDPIDVLTTANFVGFEDEADENPFVFVRSSTLPSDGYIFGASLSTTGTEIGEIADFYPRTTGGSFLASTNSQPATVDIVVTPAPVPEPASVALLGSGLAAMGALRRKLRRG